MIDFDQLPLEYETMFKDVSEFVGEADNEAQLELLRGLMAQMVEDAVEITNTRLSGQQTAAHLIDVWRKKRYKELGYPVPRKQEPEEPGQPPEVDEEDKLMPVTPQGTEPDAALLEDDGPDMAKFKPIEVIKTVKRRGRPPKHPED